ncbi:hypothetical protein ACFOYW_09125 [Gryllotalpicola reticulitermitis]|uniref:DUF4232 domain-containing protein n=1 Tax=Gryllotalpicola reticulitermitis TaxID=1184153 RepID=A0ABV8Q5B5_9MICO
MSTPQHPVGRRSPAVYRRRRLMVLLILVAIVVLVVLTIVRPWRGSGKPAAAPASVPASSSPAAQRTGAAASPAASATPSASARPTAAATPTPSATVVAAGKPCAPASIDVEAITDASSYGATQRPLLSLSLTNDGSQMCTIDAGTAAMVFTISSGRDQYWTSTDCQTDPVHTVIKLEPRKTLTSVPIAWDRTRSSKSTCKSSTRPQAPAGGAAYHLSVAVDGIASKTTKQFLLN